MLHCILPSTIMMCTLHTGNWSHWKKTTTEPWNQPDLGEGEAHCSPGDLQSCPDTSSDLESPWFPPSGFVSSPTQDCKIPAALTFSFTFSKENVYLCCCLLSLFILVFVSQIIIFAFSLFLISFFFLWDGCAPLPPPPPPPPWLFSFSRSASAYFLPHYLSTCKLPCADAKQFF